MRTFKNITSGLNEHVPNEWEVSKLNLIASLRRGPFGGALKVDSFVSEGYAVYEQQHAIHKKLNNIRYFINKNKYKEMQAFKVEENDILLSCSGTIGESVIIPTGHKEGIINQALLRIRLLRIDLNLEYFKYYMDSFLFQTLITDNSHGSAMKNIASMNVINKIPVPVPSEGEQEKIVTFLNSKLRVLDKSIDIKYKILDLLEQQRQSIITEAVTKGLNRNVKMKDSGVEWIGETPEHWGKKKIKHLVNRMSREAKPHHEVITAFRDGQVTLRKNRREDGFTFSIKEIGYQGINEGDLVVHQMDAFAGAIGVSDSEGKASPVYTVCTAKNEEEIYLPYLCEVIRVMSKKGYIESLAKGIRERSTDFRWPDMGAVLSILPPKYEQIEITRYIDIKSNRVKILISDLRTSIDKLKEYRKSLIYEVVTGKIDVRDMEFDEVGEL